VTCSGGIILRVVVWVEFEEKVEELAVEQVYSADWKSPVKFWLDC